MTKEDIANLAKDTRDKTGLLLLLNVIRDDIMRDQNGVVHGYPFSMRQINYFCNPKHEQGRYRQFQIKKKTEGFRTITAPKSKNYKLMLRCIDVLLKSMYKPSPNAMGFIEGRSIVCNAIMHVGRNYVLNLDLKDFFPSITQARVWKRLQVPPFEFEQPVANVIAGICCMKETRTNEDGTSEDVYILPQGSPASPIITNIICDRLDRKLSGLAKRFNVVYTRYADDITFSSSHNVYQENSEFMVELHRIIGSQNFKLNCEKTRLQKKGVRQEVTGIVVNSKLNVAGKYVRDIRNLLYIWERYGHAQAYAKFYARYKSEKGHVKHGDPNMINVLDGKLQYLKMVKGEGDAVYKRLYSKYRILVDRETGGIVGKNGFTFMMTYDVMSFEKEMNTVIQIVHETCKVSHGDQSEETDARSAQFKIDDQIESCRVSKKILPDQECRKEILCISRCKDKNGYEFWLLHHKREDYQTPHQDETTIDIDDLNKELDSLLE